MSIKRNLGDTPDFGSKGRRIVFIMAIVLLAVVFSGRLAQLQIVRGDEYKFISEAQAIKEREITANRGFIYDRNGELIVHNEPSFAVTITEFNFDEKVIPLLASLMEVDTTEIHERIKKYRTGNKFQAIKIFRDLEEETIAKIEEYINYLPGVDIVIDSKRLYDLNGNMAHVLGYTREISRRQLESKPYYDPGDMIGQTGIEHEYESDLKGQDGINFIAVNKVGRKIGSFEDYKNDINAINGSDLILGIDIKLQEKAEELLAGKRGSVVAIDPRNGDVIILASKPDFDPREFSGKIPPGLYSSLANDETSPLLHRSVMSQYPPGSTWKMLVAIAAMNEGIIDEKSLVHSTGSFYYGGRNFGDHAGAGSFDVVRAIQTSSNVFFYKMGLKIGYENLEKYGNMFHFGRTTGIDLPNEKPGRLPTRDWLKKLYGKNGDTEGRLVNYGIGQGEIMVTPLQMAAYTAAIANGGTYHQPHVVKAIRNSLTGEIQPLDYNSEELPIKKEIFKYIQEGMYKVVNEPGGTARRARMDSIKVCGKTGTAQNPHGKDHAWFVCYAPKENPEIAMAVFVENSGYGGSISAPIAKELLQNYFFPSDTIPESEEYFYDPSTPLDSIPSEMTLNLD